MKTWILCSIVFVVLLAIALVKIGIRVTYNEKNFGLELLVGGRKLDLRAKKLSAKTPKPKKKQAPSRIEDTKTKKKATGIFQNPWVQAILEYWQDIIAMIGRVLRSPTLDDLKLIMMVGGGDAEACAMKYGKICAIIAGVLPVIENTFGIRKRQINVQCCYDRDSVDIQAEAAITVQIYEIFALVFALLGLGIKILLYANKMKKAVQL